MLDFDKIFSRNDSDNIMIVSENAPFGNRFLSPEMKALINNYTQSAKAKSAGTTPPKNTAKKKDSFLEGFNDPYGEKNAFPRQSLAQRMMAQFTNPAQQTPQSPMIKTETPKYALPNIGNSNNNYSEKKVEAPKTELRASPAANTSEDDAFREGFNYYNDKELMFPNTELHAKPENYGMMFPNTQLHASPSENKPEDDAFLDGFNDPYGEKEKEEKSKWQKVLDGISTGLTAASFIPGLDTVTNLAQIPVDLLRGDFLGAGLDLVGIIPFIGEAADVAKTARTADRIIDGVRAADKVTDGIKAADAVSDGIRVAEATSDSLKTSENLYDAAKSADITGLSKRDQLLSKATNQKVKEAVNQIYRPNAQIGDGGLGDAIRHELATGDLVGGKSHIQKGQERLKNLENILKSENLSADEERMVMDLIDDLQKALKGEKYDK